MRLAKLKKPERELLEYAGCGDYVHHVEYDGYDIDLCVAPFFLKLEAEFIVQLGAKEDPDACRLIRAAAGLEALESEAFEALKTELRMRYRPGDL